MIQRFIQYVSAFDSSFASRIEGATSVEVRELAAVTGLPLPSSLQQYLEAMGRRDGGLELAFEGTSDIRDLLDAYRNQRIHLPGGTIAIGIGAQAMDAACLDLSNGAPEPKVILVANEKPIGLYAESLPKLLFRAAFAKFRMKALPNTAYLACTGRHRMLQGVSSELLALGFKRLAFSDTIAICCERQGVAAFAIQYEGQGGGLTIAADQLSEVHSIAEAIVGSQRYLTRY